jgi:PAS domain S-box-containing protein
MKVMKKSKTSESQSETEIALKESEQRYRTTMMSVGDGVIATDTEGRVEMMNPIAEELTGWKQEEAHGKSLEKIFHIINEETRQTVENPLRRVMREGTVVGLANHSVLIAKDGTERPIANSGAPIRNEKDDITGMVLVFRDQAKERMAQRALQESELKFRETVKNLDEGYYSCKMDGVLLDHNQAFNRILGFDIAKDLKGEKLPDFWQNPDDRKVYLQELMTRGFIRNYLINAKTNGGEKIVVMANSHLVKDEKGELMRIEGTYTDFTDRKRAEEQLLEALLYARNLIEASLDPLVTISSEGKIMDVNKATEEVTGVGRGKLIGSDFSDYFTEPEKAQAGYRKVLADRLVIDYPLTLRHTSGKTTDVLYNATVYRNEKGKIQGVFAAARDITERKRAEEALRNSEAFLNNIIDQSPVPMWISDDKGILIRINKACCSILKITEQDVIGKYNVIEDNIVQEQGLLSDVRRVFDNGETVRFEIRYNTSKLEGFSLESEAEIILDTTIFPIKDYKGKVTNAVIQHMDITDRKRAEEALKISKERLVFATEGAKLGIWNWDTVTGELIWSDKCKELFGIPHDETMSYPRFSDALHPDDRDRTDRAVNDALENHKDYDIEYRSLWPDGSIHWLEAKGRGFYDATGKAVRLEGIVLDIAESKRTEEEIRKLNAELEDRVAKRTTQLEASNKELEAFSYSVSHDLRAPLRHVSGYVELLNKHFQSDLPEKGQHYLNSIADSVRIMGMLIDDLLQFSKTGRMEMHQSDFDMNEVVKEVIESLSKDNPDRKIDWVLGKLASVNGDEAMLRVVWTNLLSNAVKFTCTRKQARIEIGVRKENKELVFFVRDNGVGFDMQYAQKLFGVFQRLHPTEEFEGTGIGLANVHRIILRQGGRTWAEAELDKGAVFYFSIPNK